MSERKNYATLFLALCRKKEVWFSVCTDSSVDTITYLKDGHYIDSQTSAGYKFGTKGAYEWLKSEIKEIEDDLRTNP